MAQRHYFAFKRQMRHDFNTQLRSSESAYIFNGIAILPLPRVIKEAYIWARLSRLISLYHAQA